MSSTPLEESEVKHGHFSQVKFDDLPLSAEGKRAMQEGFGYVHLTTVQEKTFEPVIKGHDLVVRAKTGAGKTLSFLLPVMEALRDMGPNGNSKGIQVLIVSPVRELSMQIFNEACKLAQFYTGITPLCMVGGADWREDIEALEAVADSAILLVVTPGRLQTHLCKTDGFVDRVAPVRVVVLDEVDQLVGPSFHEATGQILNQLSGSSSQRQSLFYSATMSDVVITLMTQMGKADYAYVDMLQDDLLTVPEDIEQTYRVVPTEEMTLALSQTIESARQKEATGLKMVVIFMTGRIAAYYAEAYRRSGTGVDVYEIHAQIKKQEKRTEASDQFRAAQSGILFTSDVSSRGLDYPGVTDVIQHGAPRSKAEYIHRLGRTGRAGNKGRGVLLLHEFERGFLPELSDLSLLEVPWDVDGANVDKAMDFASMDIAQNIKAQAYYSRINHAMRNYEHLGKLEILREAKCFASSIGAVDEEGRPPEITQENAEKMGIADISDAAVHIVATAANQPKPKQKVRTRAPKGLFAPGSNQTQAEGRGGYAAAVSANLHEGNDGNMVS